MLRKAALLNISIFIILLCVVFAGKTHSAAAATNTAAGTYTYTSGTGELVLNFTYSDFILYS